ncbi:MAG: molybdopterin molybdenumtransferase MoeA, partial [Bacteroidetes bacterium HGW-Bacteroidetes-22]
MISLTEAQAIVLQTTQQMPTSQVDLLTSLGRHLAVDVVSDIDMPPFRKAAVDGYACRRSELFCSLSLSGILAAGSDIPKNLPPQSCFKIMTGAQVPEASDCIFMVEQSSLTPDGKVVFTGAHTNSNICMQGEDCRTGEIVVKRNTYIEPQHIAIFASVGYTQVDVYRKPRVAVIVTGDELTEPDKKPEGSHIRNSNGWQLIAQVMKAGAEADYRGIVSDKEASLCEAISRAAATNDIILLTGGVSMGDFDFVPDVLQQLGAAI